LNLTLPTREIAPAPTGKRSQAEFRLACVIADVLRLRGKPGLYWTHLPFGEVRSARTGARLKRVGTRAGAPDYLLIWNGRPIGLELKAEGGRQTESQRDTETDWTLAGGLYACCKGYAATVAFLDEVLQVLKPDRSFIPAKGRET
jgi:hypothetical protein